MCFWSDEEDKKSQDLLLTQVAITSHQNLNLQWDYAAVHYENTPIQIYRNFTSKNWKFSNKKTPIYFIFLLKTSIVGTR